MKEVTLHQQEQARLHVLNSVIAEEITIAQAAALMNLSERHARRLLAAYRKDGAEALAHGNRGRRPHNAVPEVVAAAVVHLAATHYPGANHTHLSELLEEQEGILLSRPTLRRILTRAGLPSPRRRRPPAHRVRRERMPREGMLLQVDGSHHAWLEDRGPRFALLLAVDDATGDVPHTLFQPAEDARGYFLLMEGVLRRSGVPLALYSDRHGVFRATAQQRAGRGGSTQFARAMAELGVRLIFARSPQAKGRVERTAGTFQDRLVTELRLAQATTIAEAQTVLERFLPRFNARFRVPAAQPEPAYRPLDPALDLGAILAFRHVRTVARDNTVKYRWRTLQLLPGPERPSYAGARVEVLERPGGELAVRHEGETIPRGSPRPARACCASVAPRWRASRRWSASPRASASTRPHQAAQSSLPRRTGPPSTAPHRRPRPDRSARRPRASRRAGRRSGRPNCRDCRCAPPPGCSASRATPSGGTFRDDGPPGRRGAALSAGSDQRERTDSLNSLSGQSR